MSYEIPYADPITAELDSIVRCWEDNQKQRKRFASRAVDFVTGEVRSAVAQEQSEELQRMEDHAARIVERLMRKHPMYSWLQEAKTAGKYVARLLTIIRHPHRFPSQQCAGFSLEDGTLVRHDLLPVYTPGVDCPGSFVKGESEEACRAVVQAPRLGSGCRALWRMFGMAPEEINGKIRLARRVKGRQASHSTRAKTAILMPDYGIAAQLLRQHSRYEEVYSEAKARLQKTHSDWRPGHIETTARVIAAKRWSGDLLMEWKRLVSLDEPCAEVEATSDRDREEALLYV